MADSKIANDLPGLLSGRTHVYREAGGSRQHVLLHRVRGGDTVSQTTTTTTTVNKAHRKSQVFRALFIFTFRVGFYSVVNKSSPFP